MASVCEICEKRRNKSNKICFSNKHHRFFQYPNLQKCRVVMPNGQHKRVTACASCIRAHKIQRIG